jgi:hypothetical protein
MSDQQQPGGIDPSQMSEQELRAAYEAQLEEQLKQLRVEDVIVQTIVTLVNLGGRRAGLAPGTEGERDPEQLRLAIEGARSLLGLIEAELGQDGKAIRDALSQLQMAYAQLSGGGGGAAPAGGGEGGAGQPPQGGQPGGQQGPGPAQSSGRLWVPGQ